MTRSGTGRRTAGCLGVVLLVVGLGLTAAPRTADAFLGTEVGLGARVGGPGFGLDDKRAGCCTNPSGLFLTLDFPGFVFTELAVEYGEGSVRSLSSSSERESMYVLGSIGARIPEGGFITPYVSIGVGPEFTRIEQGGRRYMGTLIAPFGTVGAELNLWALRLGSSLRTRMFGVPSDPTAATSGAYTGDIDYRFAFEFQVSARWVF